MAIFGITPLDCPLCGKIICSQVPYYCRSECNLYREIDSSGRGCVRNLKGSCNCYPNDLEKAIIAKYDIPQDVIMEITKKVGQRRHYKVQTYRMREYHIWMLKNGGHKSKQILPEELFDV
jgi:hypothetical protein